MATLALGALISAISIAQARCFPSAIAGSSLIKPALMDEDLRFDRTCNDLADTVAIERKPL